MSVIEEYWPRARDPEVALARLEMASADYALHEATRSKPRPWYRNLGNQNVGRRAAIRRFRRYMSNGRAYR
jgi:hypothetical protein